MTIKITLPRRPVAVPVEEIIFLPDHRFIVADSGTLMIHKAGEADAVMAFAPGCWAKVEAE